MEATALLALSEPTDLDLIRRWQGGDSRAATAIVERHGAAIARFVTSVGERDAVDEVVQDTFVRAFNAIESFRGESAFRTWLLTIARRLVFDRRRSARRSRFVSGVEEDAVVTHTSPLDTLVADESLHRVRQAVDSLSPRQREVFLLRVEQGLSYKEIAEMIGSTEGATRVHYHNAMHAVKEQLHA